MGEDECQTRREGAEDMGRLAVIEVIEAAAHCLAVEGDVAVFSGLDLVRLGQSCGVLAEHQFHAGRVELLQNPTDRRVGWSRPPFQIEKLTQARQMHVDERVDGAVRVRPGDRRQDGE